MRGGRLIKKMRIYWEGVIEYVQWIPPRWELQGLTEKGEYLGWNEPEEHVALVLLIDCQEARVHRQGAALKGGNLCQLPPCQTQPDTNAT